MWAGVCGSLCFVCDTVAELVWWTMKYATVCDNCHLTVNSNAAICLFTCNIIIVTDVRVCVCVCVHKCFCVLCLFLCAVHTYHKWQHEWHLHYHCLVTQSTHTYTHLKFLSVLSQLDLVCNSLTSHRQGCGVIHSLWTSVPQRALPTVVVSRPLTRTQTVYTY